MHLPTLLSELSLIADAELLESDVLTIEQIDAHFIQLNCSDFEYNFLNISFPADDQQKLSETLRALSDKLSQTN